MVSDIDVLKRKVNKRLNVEIEYIPYSKIAYLRQTGTYGESNVQVMERIKLWAESNSLLNEQTIILGIAHDNPEFVEPQNCRYDTCIVISKDYRIKDNSISEGSISGGKYAVFKIKHTAEDIKKAWNGIFPELFSLNCQLDETRPILERYRASLVKEHYCEICVPVH